MHIHTDRQTDHKSRITPTVFFPMFQERIMAANVYQDGSVTSVPLGGWPAATQTSTAAELTRQNNPQRPSNIQPTGGR
jgi:hypothetical protein